MTDDPRVVIVAPDGQPARRAKTKNCPRCGAGPEKREPSCGFGVAHPVCSRCGFEWFDEEWHG